MSVRRIGVVALTAAGIAFGALTLAITRRELAFSLAGASSLRAAAELTAGWSLLAAGAVAWARRPQHRFGPLLVAASFGWFLAEWNNPGIGSEAGFALGQALYAVASPLVAHAALVYLREGRMSHLERVVLATAYAGAFVVLGLAPALVFDPAAEVCTQCPRNLLLGHGSTSVYDAVNRIGVHAGLLWSIALGLLLARRAAASAPARYVVIPATAYVGLVAAEFAHSLGRGTLGTDSTDRDLWLAEAAALGTVAAGVAWGWIRARRARAAVARLVVEVARSPAPGALRDLLATLLHDPSVALGYPLDDGRLVDARGRPLVPEGEVTPLVRRGETVAFLSHRPRLLDDPALVEEVAAAARLALENERLQAAVHAQLEALRESRARVIAAGDAERRRLERDLHDGAQQQLVGLSLQLELARSGRTADVAARIDDAEAELAAALSELRELAHGVFPAVLADDGLVAALEALTEEAPVEIHPEGVPAGRLDAAVEAAAYFVVSETIRRSRPEPGLVAVAGEDGWIVVDVEAAVAPDDVVALGDRVGAAGGTLEATPQAAGLTRIHAEIPCGS
jgi:signal transduction histidine kinase